MMTEIEKSATTADTAIDEIHAEKFDQIIEKERSNPDANVFRLLISNSNLKLLKKASSHAGMLKEEKQAKEILTNIRQSINAVAMNRAKRTKYHEENKTSSRTNPTRVVFT